MDEIPVSSLSIRGTEVAIGVNLHQCPAFVLRIKGEDFAATIDEGRRPYEVQGHQPGSRGLLVALTSLLLFLFRHLRRLDLNLGLC